VKPLQGVPEPLRGKLSVTRQKLQAKPAASGPPTFANSTFRLKTAFRPLPGGRCRRNQESLNATDKVNQEPCTRNGTNNGYKNRHYKKGTCRSLFKPRRFYFSNDEARDSTKEARRCKHDDKQQSEMSFIFALATRSGDTMRARPKKPKHQWNGCDRSNQKCGQATHSLCHFTHLF